FLMTFRFAPWALSFTRRSVSSETVNPEYCVTTITPEFAKTFLYASRATAFPALSIAVLQFGRPDEPDRPRNRTQDLAPFCPSRPALPHVGWRLLERPVRGGLAVASTSVPPSQGGNELKGYVVSEHANAAPCPVTPRLMQEIEKKTLTKPVS